MGDPLMADKLRRFKSKEKKQKPVLAGGRVTALEAQVKDPRRSSLYIDGRFVLGLSEIVAAQVKVGQELSLEEVARLAADEEFETAREKALHYLEYRPRSEDEIRRQLGKTYPREVIDRVIVRLREAGLLGDKEFARFWVETRETFKPRSPRALKYELRQKGVPAQVIERAVKNIDEGESAYRAARSKAERWRELEYREFQTKLGGFLARRGFNYGIIKETVRRIYREIHSEETGLEQEEVD